MIRLFRRSRGAREPSPELESELDREPLWMYPWEVGDRVAPLLNPELPDVHRTRAEMIEGPVREALAAAGPDATAIDVACSEGWFSQRLLDWGAARVIGVDVRESNVRRAALVRDHLGIDAERLSFERSDVYDLDPAKLGRFDVVLCLGLVYHLENPVGAVRIVRALTGGACMIESQLTRQNEPIEHGWGVTDVTVPAEPSFAGFVEPGQDTNPAASIGGIISLVPNRAAMEAMARVAGFESVEFLTAGRGHNKQYVIGDRAIVVAR